MRTLPPPPRSTRPRRRKSLFAGVVVASIVAFPAQAQAQLTGPDAASSPSACRQWSVKTVASGLGSLENLEFDRRGGLLVSATAASAIKRIRPNGRTTTLIADVDSPGGLRVRRHRLYFNTGDSSKSGVTGATDGTVGRFNLRTGRRRTWARGLTMPNGLAFLPDGDAVVSRAVGSGTGVTRIRRHPRRVQTNWARVDDTNGLAVDPDGRWLYAAQTFKLDSPVIRIRISNPDRIETVARLGGLGIPKGLDDMTLNRRGILFVAANASGEIIRLNPATGSACVIARGLQRPSAVKFGVGPGWSSKKLYVSSFDGTVRELKRPDQGLANDGSRRPRFQRR